MVQALRAEFVYAEKRARDFIFQAVEGVLGAAGAPLIISKLTREVSARARSRAHHAGFDLSNWDTAAKATVNAMLASGVLLAPDGRPIPLTIAAQAADVARLAAGYRDATEAHLLTVLIRRLGDVTARDHIAMAHALFRQFDPSVAMEDMEDRVARLLASLEGRVAVGDGGAYCVLAGNSATA
jgi:hypothetical protein